MDNGGGPGGRARRWEKCLYVVCLTFCFVQPYFFFYSSPIGKEVKLIRKKIMIEGQEEKNKNINMKRREKGRSNQEINKWREKKSSRKARKKRGKKRNRGRKE